MSKPSVLILYSLPHPFYPNGSPDHIGRRSVRSRLQAVQKALVSLGYGVQTLEAKDSVPALLQEILAAKVDLVFNLCEEFFGHTRLEMNIAALLELLGIPFTGSSALVLGLSQDKGKTKAILAHHNIPTPLYRVWQPGTDEVLNGLPFPLIVKPLCEDASLGIDNDAFVRDEKALMKQVRKIYRQYGPSVLIEEFIEGRELNVSILGNEDPRLLPISEIDFSSLPAGLPKICGYSAKWEKESEEFCHTVPRCPVAFPPAMEERIFQVSLQSFYLMGCRDYARIDIRLSPEGIPYVLEVNANPDISPDAGIIRSAKSGGIPYPDFIGSIVELALARRPSLAGRQNDKGLSAEGESPT
jgi:D-alanine-D-alanine ligase